MNNFNPESDEQLEANRLDDLPELDSHWNYRIIRKIHEYKGEKYVQFGIHEVYYSNGKPDMCSVDALAPSGDTLEELKQALAWYQLALTKPILNYEDIGNESTDTKTTS